MKRDSVRSRYWQGEDHAVGQAEFRPQRLRRQALSPQGREAYRVPVLPQQPGQCTESEIAAHQPEAMFLP